MVNTQLIGLSAFLVRDGGLNSDFMLAQYTVASLVSENRALSHPAFIRLRRKPRSWPWGNAFMCDIPFQQSIYHASADFAHRRMTHRSPRLREARYSGRRKVGVGGYGFGDHGLHWLNPQKEDHVSMGSISVKDTKDDLQNNGPRCR